MIKYLQGLTTSRLVQSLSLLSRTHPKKALGQDLTEYGLLVALIAIVVVVAVLFFGTSVSAFFVGMANTIAVYFLVP